MNMLWDDIDSLDLIFICSCGCKYGASQQLSKFCKDQRVIQFLMGLNDSYAMIRGFILMRSPLLTVSKVCSLLLREESQMEIHFTGQFLVASASLNANASKSHGSSMHTQGFYQSQKKFSPASSDSRKSLHCNFCKVSY